MKLLVFLLATSLWISQISSQLVQMNRDGCGEVKGCLFKPAGCDPMRDCTIGIIFYVSGPNLLTIQVVATTLLPPPSLQYIAIGFSHDSMMGDDMVSECVISPTGDEFALEPEVFVSYNIGKSNDRIYLNATEQAALVRDIQGEAVNGRVSCQWSQQIIPQQSSQGGRLWNLNHKYYIMGATGSAQPAGINSHDTAMASHFYPIVSARPINPSVIGVKIYDLPKPWVAPDPPPTPPPKPTTTTVRPKKSSANKNSAFTFMKLFALFCISKLLLLVNNF